MHSEVRVLYCSHQKHHFYLLPSTLNPLMFEPHKRRFCIRFSERCLPAAILIIMDMQEDGNKRYRRPSLLYLNSRTRSFAMRSGGWLIMLVQIRLSDAARHINTVYSSFDLAAVHVVRAAEAHSSRDTEISDVTPVFNPCTSIPPMVVQYLQEL